MAVRNPSNRKEIRLAGEGGQGMILAGIILAEAAAIYDNWNKDFKDFDNKEFIFCFFNL